MSEQTELMLQGCVTVSARIGTRKLVRIERRIERVLTAELAKHGVHAYVGVHDYRRREVTL